MSPWDPLPTLPAPEGLLVQVFQNLLGNAIKYQGKNNVPEVKVFAKEKEDHWEISVQDNGIGIPEDQITKVFTPFYRLHSKSEYNGTGLGLATCIRILKRFGGDLLVKSDLGEGSFFYVHWPKNPLESVIP